MLCACSPLFKDMLTRQPPSPRRPDLQPVVFLKDVSPVHFERLLQFMYCGKVQVPNNELEDLLATATSLRIHGLAQPPPSLVGRSSPPPPPIPEEQTKEDKKASSGDKTDGGGFRKKKSRYAAAAHPFVFLLGNKINVINPLFEVKYLYWSLSVNPFLAGPRAERQWSPIQMT